MSEYDVLIVGGGHAGAQAAAALRQNGFAGSIALVGEEPDLPYERPPLSKEYLAGGKPFDRILIRPARFWADKNIELLLGRRVVAVDPARHCVETAEGARIGYGTLIWATGGAPRRLTCTGHDLARVHAIRTRADVDRLRGELDGIVQVVVIGGGYIGLEAAAVLTGLGRQVTVMEAAPRVLSRVVGEPLSRFYEAEHRARGVDVRLGAIVTCIEESDGGASGVRLAGGEVIACDAVIVGIGITPAVEPLLAAGAAGDNGVDVDAHCRTSLPDIYAIGDCAACPNPFAEGARLRIESVGNANNQATITAKAIIGKPQAFDTMPWFWSNQYDLRLQTVGLSGGHDAMVIRGDMTARSFSVIYLADGRVVALDCVNATRDYVQGRALVAAGAVIPNNRLADTSVPLKELMS